MSVDLPLPLRPVTASRSPGTRSRSSRAEREAPRDAHERRRGVRRSRSCLEPATRAQPQLPTARMASLVPRCVRAADRLARTFVISACVPRLSAFAPPARASPAAVGMKGCRDCRRRSCVSDSRSYAPRTSRVARQPRIRSILRSHSRTRRAAALPRSRRSCVTVRSRNARSCETTTSAAGGAGARTARGARVRRSRGRSSARPGAARRTAKAGSAARRAGRPRHPRACIRRGRSSADRESELGQHVCRSNRRDHLRRAKGSDRAQSCSDQPRLKTLEPIPPRRPRASARRRQRPCDAPGSRVTDSPTGKPCSCGRYPTVSVTARARPCRHRAARGPRECGVWSTSRSRSDRRHRVSSRVDLQARLHRVRRGSRDDGRHRRAEDA